MTRYLDINQPGYSIKCKIMGENIREIKKVILYAHGYGGHKDTKAAEHFADTALSKMKKTAVLVFDWPAHGTDVRKKLTLADCDTYLTIVLDYIREQLKVEDICAYGTSFGGYLIFKYIHDHNMNPFRKVVLRCPAVSMFDIMLSRVVTDDNRAMLAKGKDILTGFDRKVMIEQSFLDELSRNDIRTWDFIDYADDIFIIHGTKDELVPFNEVKDFAENNVIEFIAVDGADHRFQNLDLLKLAHSHMVDFLR